MFRAVARLLSAEQLVPVFTPTCKIYEGVYFPTRIAHTVCYHSLKILPISEVKNISLCSFTLHSFQECDWKYSPIFENICIFVSVKCTCYLFAHFSSGLFVSLFLNFLFENKVFIFGSLLLYFFLLSPTRMGAKSCSRYSFFFFFLIPASQTVCFLKIWLTCAVPHSAWSLMLPPGDQTKPEVDPTTSDTLNSLGTSQEIIDLASQFVPITWENSASANFYFQRCAAADIFFFALSCIGS